MFKSVALAAAVSVLVAAGADAALVYPTSVIAADQNGTTVLPVRSNTGAALGPADGVFYSLGLGGSITFDFGQLVGGEGLITEVTWGNVASYPEYAQVLTSLNGKTWTPLTLSFNGVAVGGEALFSPTAFRYLTLRDATSGSRGDGFDIDSVAFAPVPLPAAGLALASGLTGLAALRRRRG